MDTVQQVLQALQKAEGPLSGEALAHKLALSRTAVWKAVNRLRAAGIEIEGRPRTGYRLHSGDVDLFTAETISRYLNRKLQSSIKLQVLAQTVSTNAGLKQAAAEGAPAWTCFAAASQSGGRGRRGRSFFSPEGGVYLSLLLRPRRLRAAESKWLTVCAALAACSAVQDLIGRTPAVKWLNDLYMDGRKICGILCEGEMSLEEDLLSSVVVGVGFNLYAPAPGVTLPPALASSMGFISPRRLPDGRARLTALFLNHFAAELQHFQPADAAARYKALSCVLGREIIISGENGPLTARVLNIDEHCCLQVRFADGTRASLQAGEISFKFSAQQAAPGADDLPSPDINTDNINTTDTNK